MRRAAAILACLALAGTLACPVKLAAQEDDDPFLDALRGLSVVWVVVEDGGELVTQAGLSQDELRDALTDRLSAAGIRVVGKGAGLADQAPFVYLRVQVSPTERGDYVWNVALRLVEPVQLVRDSTLWTTAVTWEAAQVYGTIAPEEPEKIAGLWGWVDELTDRLIRSYQVANGRTEQTLQRASQQ